MERVVLGRSGIEVSRLCFGSLTVGPLQAGLPVSQGAEVMTHAIRQGINFFDTAQLYETYPYIREAMRRSGRFDLVVSSKTYAYTAQLAREAVEQARRELDRDYIDIFMLHEQESIYTLQGHGPALEALFDYKSKGIIQAVGASMHHVAAVYGAVQTGLDVIHPLLNLDGLGIVDGERGHMEAAVAKAHNAGLGVFSMKPLGGGNLFRKAGKCLDYITGLDFIDSVALGMQSVSEVDANISYFETGSFSETARKELEGRTRLLHLEGWCEGGGKCVRRCGQRALSVTDGMAVCDHKRCVLCGYCAPVCPMWAIKVV